jgi:glucosamine--fructose-6-phosphate aminotransferase (isomerizing)
MHAVALETALKIKEVSYVHAEAFATGEMKHGPLALVQVATPVLFFAPPEPHLDQALSSMKEVAARGAIVTVLTDDPRPITEAGFQVLAIPQTPWPGRVFSAAVAGQLIAYHAAVARGCDVDRPRNLAKSVTVE